MELRQRIAALTAQVDGLQAQVAALTAADPDTLAALDAAVADRDRQPLEVEPDVLEARQPNLIAVYSVTGNSFPYGPPL